MKSVLLIGVMMALSACERAAPPVSVADSTAAAPTREAWDVRLSVNDNERPRVRLDAGYMATFEADTLVHVLTGTAPGSTVSAELFDEMGQPSARLTADTLYYYERDRRFVAAGGVVVVTTAGRRLETPRLTWLEADKRIRAPGFARITSPTEDVRGYNLDAAEDLSTYRLTRIVADVEVDE